MMQCLFIFGAYKVHGGYKLLADIHVRKERVLGRRCSRAYMSAAVCVSEGQWGQY